MTKKGEAINENVASILQKLNIQQFEVGLEPVAIVDIEYTRLGNQVTLLIPEFVAGPVGFFGIPIVSDTSLPLSIRPAIKNFVLGTVIVSQIFPPLPPTAQSCIIQIGPSVIIIYKGLTQGGYTATDTAVILAQSFTYLIN